MALNDNRNDIIIAALRIIGAVSEEEDPSTTQMAEGAATLDDMVKEWQADGAHLWTTEEATVFLQPGQAKYILGDSSDKATDNFTQTTLSADQIATDTVLSLTSSVGLAVADNIGTVMDDGTIFWSTVTIVAPVTIADPLPSAAASGNIVYFYTIDVPKPLRIPFMRRRQNEQDIEMIQIGRPDYFNLPNKEIRGTPVQYFYNPDISVGELFIWNTPNDVKTTLKMTYYRPIEVFSDAADKADFPGEWIGALKYKLAILLAPLNQMTLTDDVRGIAAEKYGKAMTWDQGDAPVYFQYGRGRGQ